MNPNAGKRRISVPLRADRQRDRCAPPAAGDKAKTGVNDLDGLDPDLLRRRWRAVLGRPAPSRLSRQLMIRILGWREQIAGVGDLDASILAILKSVLSGDSMGAATAAGDATQSRPRPGSVLVREHGGVMHRVMVLDQGYAWNGQTYGSLSSTARAITGTTWNGRRFFGIDRATKIEKRASEVKRMDNGGAP